MSYLHYFLAALLIVLLSLGAWGLDRFLDWLLPTEDDGEDRWP